MALALVIGCAKGSDVTTTVLNTTAIYSPSTGDIPLPNDLLFDESTDGTLAIPDPDDPDEQGVVDALNALDGWSRLAPMRISFSRPIDGATVVAGTSVRMFEVALTPGPALDRTRPVQSVVREFMPAEFEVVIAPESTSAIAVAPRTPLEPSTSYMIAVTDDVRGTDGFPVMRSIVYQLAAQPTIVAETEDLFPLQRAVLGMHAAAEDAGLDPDRIVVAASFTTQSIGGPIAVLRQIAQGDEPDVISTLCATTPELVCTSTTPSPFSIPAIAIDPVSVGTTFDFLSSGPDAADVYVGSLALPYYLDAAAAGGGPTDLTNDDGVLETHFRARYAFGAGDTDRNVTGFNPLPEARSQEIVPVLLTVPKGAVPPGGWPIIVYQHGITFSRETLLGLADAFAAAGFAAIAIDQPLHGQEPGANFFTSYASGGVRERTFGLDLVDNTTGDEVPDGLVDETGEHFINLANLRTSRDNLMQAVADLFALTVTLDDVDYDGNPGGDLDVTHLYFIGHSLGGIVGTTFLTQAPEVVAAVLAMPGGGIAKLLQHSVSYGPDIEEGLADEGILAGTPEFESFLFAAQTVIDGADPTAHAAILRTTDKPVLCFEIVGEAGVSLPDQVIPNSAPNAPLAGTEPLVQALGLQAISSNTVDATGLRGVVRFVRGDHTSLILPITSAAATFEMQAMTTEFFASNGQMVSIINGFVVL